MNIEYDMRHIRDKIKNGKKTDIANSEHFVTTDVLRLSKESQQSRTLLNTTWILSISERAIEPGANLTVQTLN